jgi:sulfite exporter TauE/SafE
MFFFGLGTLPATLLAGAASLSLKQGLNHPWVRACIALSFIFFGLYLFYSLYFIENGVHHH